MKENNPNNTLEEAIIESLHSTSLRDLTVDLTEVALDQMLEAGPLRDIPILGTLVKAKMSVGLVRDYVFMKKVAKFLIGVGEIPEEKRRAFMQKITARGESKKLGKTLLILLDRNLHDVAAYLFPLRLQKPQTVTRIKQNSHIHLTQKLSRKDHEVLNGGHHGPSEERAHPGPGPEPALRRLRPRPPRLPL